MFRIAVTLSVLALGASVMLGAAIVPPSDPLLSLPFLTDGPCTSYCYDSEEVVGCNPNQHIALDDDRWNKNTGEHHEHCVSGSCANKHPLCDGGHLAGLDLEHTRRAIMARDTREFKAIVRLLGDNAEVSISRQALQVFGCNGEVALHLPLPVEMVRSFAAE
ncbi:hypothetical protein BH23GEM9_BH23GEM9_18580 [soil metagenome]